jgi:multicomponent Na+:H+ antiporter subunit E
MLEIQDKKEAHNKPSDMLNTERAQQTPSSKGPYITQLITFLILFIVWVLLSGKLDAFHIALGIISCIIVTFFSSDLLFPNPQTKGLIQSWLRFLKYIPWLLYQVFLANLHILYVVFHPRMMDLIDPEIIRFQSKTKNEMALLTFANSITLTPGTITVYVSVDGDFQVHAIDKKSGDALPGEMETRVLKTFGEI